MKQLAMPEARQKWPKAVAPLTPSQEAAREAWMLLWHEQLPHRFGIAEKFNNGFVANLPFPQGCRTLEVGPGIGGHLESEDLKRQDYHVLEMREEFCQRLAVRLSPSQVHRGSIEERQDFEAGFFNRVIAIHVLEHLPNLPSAIFEIDRILSADGVFDVVLPCEGGLAYSFAREISSKRMFEKQFQMSYTPIIRSEHVNQLWEVNEVIFSHFTATKRTFFPLRVPLDAMNLFVGYRLVKR